MRRLHVPSLTSVLGGRLFGNPAHHADESIRRNGCSHIRHHMSTMHYELSLPDRPAASLIWC